MPSPCSEVERYDAVLEAIHLVPERRAILDRHLRGARIIEDAVLSFLLETGAAELVTVAV